MANIALWDDLDYMVDEMKGRPYDWELNGDLSIPDIDPYWKNLGEAVERRNKGIHTESDDLFDEVLDILEREDFIVSKHKSYNN